MAAKPAAPPPAPRADTFQPASRPESWKIQAAGLDEVYEKVRSAQGEHAAGQRVAEDLTETNLDTGEVHRLHAEETVAGDRHTLQQELGGHPAIAPGIDLRGRRPRARRRPRGDRHLPADRRARVPHDQRLGDPTGQDGPGRHGHRVARFSFAARRGGHLAAPSCGLGEEGISRRAPSRG